MANEPFDPETVTVEELAAYSRKVRRARWSGVVAGALLVWPAYLGRYASAAGRAGLGSNNCCRSCSHRGLSADI